MSKAFKKEMLAAAQLEVDAAKRRRERAEAQASSSSSLSSVAYSPSEAAIPLNESDDPEIKPKRARKGDIVTSVSKSYASPSTSSAALDASTPAGLLQKDILDLLKETRKDYSFDDIKKLKGIQIAGNTKLLESLKCNARVRYDELRGLLTYRPEHEAYTKEAVIELLREMRGKGLPTKELHNCYLNAEQELKELVAERRLFVAPSHDGKQDQYFYNDERYVHIRVDERIKSFWAAIQVPQQEVDFEREMVDAGLKSQVEKREIGKMMKDKAQIAAEKVPRKKPVRKNGAGRHQSNAHINFDFSVPYQPPPSESQDS